MTAQNCIVLRNLILDEQANSLSQGLFDDDECIRDCTIREMKNALKKVIFLPELDAKTADEIGQMVLEQIKAERGIKRNQKE